MILKRRSRRKHARIEMVPLIDIVFLLLVFFIYAMLSMAVHRGMQVDLPESISAPSVQESPLSVSVRVEDDRVVIYLNRRRVTLDGLEDALRRHANKGTSGSEVLLFADRSVSYQQLYRVLDRISVAGVSAISLQAEQQR